MYQVILIKQGLQGNNKFRTPDLWDFAMIPEFMHLTHFMEYWSTGVLDFIGFYPSLHHSNTPFPYGRRKPWGICPLLRIKK